MLFVMSTMSRQSRLKTQYLLYDSNSNVNSMINRRVSLFYRYPLKAFHHMVCPCTLYGVCVECPGTSELVGQHPAPGLPQMVQQEDCKTTACLVLISFSMKILPILL